MTSRSRPRSFLLLSGAFLLAAASLTHAAAPANNNLARTEAGARLTLLAASDAGDGTARANQALLSEADPLGCALGAGTTTILLSLPRAEALQRFDFLNLTAAGRFTVAASNVALPAESPRWRAVPAAGGTFGAPDEVVAADLGHVEARYLKITFETQAPGRIDTFGLFGAGAALTENPAARPRLVAYETVSTSGGAAGDAHAGRNLVGLRVLRVSSGTGAPDRIVDGSLGTGHAFAASDRRPATLLDLGTRRHVTRVNVACRTATPGRLDLYALSKREDAEGPLPPAGRQPDATVRVEGGRAGLSRLSVPLTIENARFLAIVFVPESGGSPVEAKDFKDSKDTRDYKGGGNDDAPGAGRSTSLPPTTEAGAPPPDGSFVLTEVSVVGPGVTGPGDFSVNSILPPGTASNTFFNPGTSSPLDTPILPPPVGTGVITP